MEFIAFSARRNTSKKNGLYLCVIVFMVIKVRCRREDIVEGLKYI